MEELLYIDSTLFSELHVTSFKILYIGLSKMGLKVDIAKSLFRFHSIQNAAKVKIRQTNKKQQYEPP